MSKSVVQLFYIIWLSAALPVFASGKPILKYNDEFSSTTSRNGDLDLKHNGNGQNHNEITDNVQYEAVTALYSMENDTSIIRPSTESTIVHLDRKRRYAYEDTADWEYDLDALDYEGESEDAMIVYLTKHWKRLAIKGFLGLCFLCFGGICCYVWCAGFCTALKVGICYLLAETCIGKLCRKCGCIKEDKGYNRMKSLFAMMGMKLDYDTYNEIRGTISDACKSFDFDLDKVDILER